MLKKITILLILFIFCALFAFANREISFNEPTSEEYKLHKLINDYRKRKNLFAIKLSKSLSHVAQIHAKDLDKYPPRGVCNMHSWSKNGNWTPCCYTRDHRQAACMWNKPKELTNYKGYGFECSYMHSMSADAKGALQSWQGSTGHNNVIINQGTWKNIPWKSIGVGIYRKYAVIWFGREEDPDGYWE